MDKCQGKHQTYTDAWPFDTRLGDFINWSRKTIYDEVLELSKGINKKASIGIYGTAHVAVFIYQALQKIGFDDLIYVSSRPPANSLQGVPVVDLAAEALQSRDVVLCSSLANAHEQRELLENNKFEGRILDLGYMPQLSPTLFDDHASVAAINSLQNAHVGSCAFVIGNGPSLAETNPADLADYGVTFAGNGILCHESFVPDYYFALDTTALQHWSDKIETCSSRKFIVEKLGKTIKVQFPQLDFPDNVYVPACYRRTGDLNISSWARFGFETGNTIICPMLQMAAWMGCDPIYLLGVDLSHDRSGNHFSDSYYSDSFKGYSDKQLESFRNRIPEGINRSLLACKAKGHTVINLAPVNRFPSIAAMPFSELLQTMHSHGQAIA